MPPEPTTDTELIAACLEGHAWAWDDLVDRYRRLVYSIPMRAGLTPEDAADVFQTVFIQLLKNLERIRDPKRLGPWLVTTTKRESWRTLRKRRREPSYDDVATKSASAKGWVQETHPEEDKWIEQILVRNAVGQLGDRCRELLKLLYYDPDEPSYKEVSRIMRLPLGSVGPTRARCLQKLRGIIEAVRGDEK